MAGGDAEQETLYELFRRARDGDEEALDRLLQRVRPTLLREIRSRVQSSTSTNAVAEELTQKSLVRVAKGLSGCRAQTGTQLRAWCRTIARRIVIDHYRRRSEEQERRVGGALDDIPWHVKGDDGPRGAPEGPTVASRDVDRALGRLLMEVQEVLTPGTQVVVVRRLLYGDTWQEAGEFAGTTEGGAKRRFQRATTRLRQELLDRIREEPDEELRQALLERVGEHL